MGIRDRLTDAIGGVIGGGLGLMTDSLEKANSRRSDEPSRRETDGTTAMSMATEKAPLPQEAPTDDPKGLLYDPFALIDQLGYRERPSGLTYNTLRQMATRVPTYTAILQTRSAQVSSFGQRQRDKYEPGFGVMLRDDKASPTRIDNTRMRTLEDFLLQTGFNWHPGRDNFRTFLRKLTGDSLTLDQGCFEIQRNKKGLPAAFYALDGATFRMADVPPGADSQLDMEQVKYVQVYDEIIISEFAAHELCFGVRNPRSDIRVNGYGFSELEMLINVITATLWSFEYNKRQFCMAPGTKVWTDKGLIPVADLSGSTFEVWTGQEWCSAQAFPTQVRPVMRTLLWNGLELKTSPEHKFRVLPRESESIIPIWAFQEALKSGDYVLLGTGAAEADLDEDQFFVGREYPVKRVTQNPWVVTSALINDPEFWEMVGFALGDGYFPPRAIRNPSWLRIFPNEAKDTEVWALIRRVCDRYQINLKDGIAKAYAPNTKDHAVLNIHHSNFVQWLYDLGFRPSSEGKIIPDLLFRSPVWLRSAVLKGLFSADGHSRHHVTGDVTPTLRVTDPSFRQTVLKCLWSVGVASQDMGQGWNRLGNIEVQDIPSFVANIGYLQPYKNQGTRSPKSVHRWDRVHPKLCRSLAQIVRAHPDWLSLSELDRGLIGCALSGKSRISRPRLISMFQALGEALPEALTFIQVPIDSVDIEQGEAIQMFDVEVFNEEHLFFADGVAVHNSQGSMVNGLLNFKGSVPGDKLDSFKRQWKLMVSGVGNAHRVPMLNVDDVQWHDFGKSNRDMEYSAWFDWLLKITCAVTLFDPAEMGFNYGNSGQTSQMFSSPVTDKLTQSKDKGLKPLLKDIAEWINVHLIWPLDPYFEFRFLGLSSKDADQAIDQGKKRSSYMMTVDELRAEEDLEPLPDQQGEVILDPTWLQNKQALEAAAQMEEGGEGEPEEGLGDVSGLEPEGGGDADPDFEAMFPEKSLPTPEEPLRKASRRAKVRVYEIDL